MNYRSPGAHSHNSTWSDGSDGATAVQYSRTPTLIRDYSPYTTFGTTAQDQSFISPYHARSPQPDWNSTQVIPATCDPLIQRLNSIQPPTTASSPNNKPVTIFINYFKNQFHGLPSEDWGFLLRSLTSTDGRRGKAPVEFWTNIKAIKVAGPTPVNFWMGAKIRREFRGS